MKLRDQEKLEDMLLTGCIQGNPSKLRIMRSRCASLSLAVGMYRDLTPSLTISLIDASSPPSILTGFVEYGEVVLSSRALRSSICLSIKLLSDSMQFPPFID